MCGICGIVSLGERQVEMPMVKAMTEALYHRGPDDEGFYQGKSVCLGHRRLSIIDLSGAGRQPMSNEDRSVWVVLNGEIYNYRELRVQLAGKGHKFVSQTDTEVLVHLYEEEGIDCVKHINGMFAFAVWDEKAKSLFLARDRIGKKPLFWGQTGDFFYFSSEIASLLESGFSRRQIDERALDYFFTFGYIPAPLSIFKDIRKLEPASVLFLEEGSFEIKKYWELDFKHKIKIGEEEAVEKARGLLEESLNCRLYSDVPLGVFLSGGIDSGLVVGLMSKCGVSKIRTFSIGFERSDYNELNYARKIAERFGTEHHELIAHPVAAQILPLLVKRYGEPYADPSAIPTYYVSKLSREFVTVALTGDGGDEVFGGYDRYQAMAYGSNFDRVPAGIKSAFLNAALALLPKRPDSKDKIYRARRFLNALKYPPEIRYAMWLGVFDDALKQRLYSLDFYRRSAGFSPAAYFGSFLRGRDDPALLDRLLSLDTSFYLPHDLLVKTDISSMSCSLEARSPLLDYRLMEFMASLDPDLKIRGGTKKYLLKRVASGIIPEENINRKKQGFGVPLCDWFRGELKDLLVESLLSKDFLGNGLFNPQAVKTLVNEHMAAREDNSLALWTMLCFEMWRKTFMEGACAK